MLPNFLIIGAMKAGTTSLYEYLRRHPQIFMPAVKELNFFVAERNWDRGRDWYEKHFQGAEAASAVGEATTHYTRFPQFEGVPKRIAGLLPDVRLIYVVRDPVDRMQSEYVYRRLGGWEKRPIDQALRSDRTYLDGSRYALQLEQYLPFFDRSQILVLKSEDLNDRRLVLLRGVFQFLGVANNWADPIIQRRFHETAEQRMPRKAGHALHKIPLYNAVSRLAPTSIKTVFKKIAATEIDPEEAMISQQLQLELMEKIWPDVERLATHVNEDFGNWKVVQQN